MSQRDITYNQQKTETQNKSLNLVKIIPESSATCYMFKVIRSNIEIPITPNGGLFDCAQIWYRDWPRHSRHTTKNVHVSKS